MGFIVNTRLRRGQYWLSMAGIIIGLPFVVVAAGSTLTLLILFSTMGWAIAARARDAGRNVVGWTLAGLLLPLCWIIIGCFASSQGRFDQATLRRTFE